MILHSGKYKNGDPVSPQHEKTILERLLPYHPECEKKIGCGVDYVTIGYHPNFETSRCLFIVRKDGEMVGGRNEETFKHSLVEWKTVCSSIRAGGVGIKQLKVQNESLLGKWLRRFSNEEFGLWKSLIMSKYGGDIGGWFSLHPSGPHGVSLWRSICQLRPKFDGCIRWQIGRGDRVLFWKHRWLEIGRLADVFPAIYAIAADQDAMVKDYWLYTDHGRERHICLRRNLNDWKVGLFVSLLDQLYSVNWTDTEDCLIWKKGRKDEFSVHSFYETLRGEVAGSFPWHRIWNSVAPSKVNFFIWCAVHGKILTMDNLKRRGYSLANRCSLCLRSEESIEHIFIHCPWTRELWMLIQACFGFCFCPPENLKSFLLAWWGQSLAKRKNELWCFIPYCLFWIVWKERNRRIFEAEESNISRLKSRFINCLYTWDRVGSEVDFYSILTFIDSLGKVG